ncbi:TetR/AcrR family transcriptional regulator [Pseudooceanicola onchidii]|uniref:TetR/AcrR family transcriptional regulator n=1 Tax=Pseudooceanicola onchidii TaxID=2562279 RepID=UPI00197E4F47|nr:TetR/AcrR family transcriptional regulator [Pseudooceanicola onchidii]
MKDDPKSMISGEGDAPAYSPRVLEILEVGARIFAEKGFDAATMRDVSEASGVSKALLYHHFESKDQFFAQIATRSARRLNDFVIERIPEQGTAAEKVRAFMIAMAEFFQEYRWAWIAASTAFWNDPDRHRQAERMERRAQLEHTLRDLIREGVDNGEFNEIDPAMTGRLILSGINWMHRWYNPKKEMTAAQIVDAYFGILLQGLAKR